MLSKKYKIILQIFVYLCFCSALSAYETKYVFPENISLTLQKQKSENSDVLTFCGIIKSKVGTLKNLDVNFNCSKDLKLTKSFAKISELRQSKYRKVIVHVFKSGKPAGEIGSWIKMRVKYLPDYKKIIKIAHIKKYYPNTAERQALINAATVNSKLGFRMINSKRIFVNYRSK